MAVDGYPALFEDRDPRTWARQHLGHIPALDPDLLATIQNVVRLIAHLADPDRILLAGSRRPSGAQRFRFVR
jgi:hypothetical protein